MIKKSLLLMLKGGVTFGALTWVFLQIDLHPLLAHLDNINWWWMALSLVFCNGMMLFGGIRQKMYYCCSQLMISLRYSVVLFYIGAFFNNFLPSGIGGDGYKVYHMVKHKQFPFKITLLRMVSNRASGVLAQITLIFILAAITKDSHPVEYPTFLIFLAAMLLVSVYHALARVLLRESTWLQIKAFLLSMVVQGCILLSGICILLAFGEAEHLWLYGLILMASQLTNIIPISIGGTGLREVVFFQAAPLLALNAELGVLLSLTYYLVQIVASIPGGMAFMLWKKEGKTSDADIIDGMNNMDNRKLD